MVQHIPSERANIYRKLILNGYKCKYLIRSDNFHYHPPDDKGLQVEFNCLLIDDRYPEGKLLRKWRKEIQRKFAKAQRAKLRRQRSRKQSANSVSHSKMDKMDKMEKSEKCDTENTEVEVSQATNEQHDGPQTESKTVPSEPTEVEMEDEQKSDEQDGNEGIVSAEDVSEFLQNVTKLILTQYPIYQRDDWDPTSLDDKDVSDLEAIATMHRYGMKYKDTFYALKLYLDRLVFPRLTFTVTSLEDSGHPHTEKVPIWLCLYSEIEREHDVLFQRNCEWMRNLTQSEVSIPREYQKQYGISSQWNSRLAVKNDVIHPELPYYDAILSFNRSKNVFVPNDMLYCWIEGLRLINTAASEYKYKNDIIRYEMDKLKGKSTGKSMGKSSGSGLKTIEEEHGDNDNPDNDPMNEMNGIEDGIEDESEWNGDEMARMIGIHSRSYSMASSPVEKSIVNLSADEMLPILIWIIIHCRIDDIHMRLGYLDKFLDYDDKYHGETGICYGFVHQAAEWVRRKEGWHLGLDEELDADKLNVQRDRGSSTNRGSLDEGNAVQLKEHQEVEM